MERKPVSGTISRPPGRVDFAVGFHNGLLKVDFSHAKAEISDQFLKRFKLLPCRLTVVEIANQADAKRDIIEVIAVDMAAVDLAPPAVAYLNLTVARGGAVADDKMVGQAVRHFADVFVIVIENLRVPLPGAAVVDHDIFPTVPRHRRAIKFGAQRTRDVPILLRPEKTEKSTGRRRHRRRL